MINSTPYQTPDAENWRLMSIIERIEIFAERIDNIVGLTEDINIAKKVVIHVLEQARHLNDSKILVGATGESNELYNQARGKTVVIGTGNAQKLPVLVQVISALVTGNEVALNFLTKNEFAQNLVKVLFDMGLSSDVIYQDGSNEAEINDMLSDVRLAQVAIVGTIEEVQELASKLSKTKGILTQIIAITDQIQLSEVFNPDFLHRFCTERVHTINTTAIGGNASLLELGVE